MGLLKRLRLASRYRQHNLEGWRFDTIKRENITEREIEERHGDTPMGSAQRSYRTGNSPPYNRDDAEYHERYAWAKQLEKELKRKWRRERWQKRLSRIPLIGSYFDTEGERHD